MCLFPFRATQDYVVSKKTGLVEKFGKLKSDHEGEIKLPCGQCVECITKRTQEWATRCEHEMAIHKENCFITLTYNTETLPSIKSFQEREQFTLFLKSLRNSLGNKKIKYIASHEFGGKTFRPHHHLIIFGWSPANQTYLKNTPAGYPIFRSPHLEKLWENGYSSTAEANASTAYYVASYALKGKSHTYTNDSGEIITVKDKMTCSRGIGLQYATKNLQQLIDSKSHIPRYYKRKLFEENPALHEQFDERESFRNPRTKSEHEKYAKFIITEKNNKSQINTFRSDDQNQLIKQNQEINLRQNRDNLVANLKESKNGN